MGGDFWRKNLWLRSTRTGEQIGLDNRGAAHDERHATETVTPEYWDDRIAVERQVEKWLIAGG
jgi:hypothetical protein